MRNITKWVYFCRLHMIQLLLLSLFPMVYWCNFAFLRHPENKANWKSRGNCWFQLVFNLCLQREYSSKDHPIINVPTWIPKLTVWFIEKDLLNIVEKYLSQRHRKIRYFTSGGMDMSLILGQNKVIGINLKCFRDIREKVILS